MKIYVIYKFNDYESVKKTLGKIQKVTSSNVSFFMFEPNCSYKNWHNYALKKLKESDLVILFDSLSGDDDFMGKHILWEIHKAEKLKKQIVIFKTDPDSKNRFWYEYDYSEQDPRHPRYKTFSLDDAIGFMKEEYGCEIKNDLMHKTENNEALSDVDKQLLLEQYRIMIETSEKLMERRQETVNLYTTLCTAIIALIGASFAFNNMIICSIVLLLSGLILVILCRNWRLSLSSYDLNNTGKFEVINYLEQQLPAEMFKCEYNYNKINGIRSFSSREKVLPKIFSSIGLALMLISGVLLLYLCLRNLVG